MIEKLLTRKIEVDYDSVSISRKMIDMIKTDLRLLAIDNTIALSSICVEQACFNSDKRSERIFRNMQVNAIRKKMFFFLS